MRYLNKVVFVNSAHVPYAEVKVDGNVHFIGTQGVGKSTFCVPSSFSTMQTRCASVFRRRKRTSMRSTCPLPIRTSSMK